MDNSVGPEGWIGFGATNKGPFGFGKSVGCNLPHCPKMTILFPWKYLIFLYNISWSISHLTVIKSFAPSNHENFVFLYYKFTLTATFSGTNQTIAVTAWTWPAVRSYKVRITKKNIFSINLDKSFHFLHSRCTCSSLVHLNHIL